ncbi:YdeI/OmpD-associated family protein [Flavobacterium silvaticum]|uniref:YdeI/OmpD-associated family protein n=1 Tax=Flavobacterium silvaticum TaxID=1852020 RepID=A0A972FL50_9FLAO|nr:YdeI/OmpD-associated family protein [Flavobacterium silvaticum]NMH28044.1 YdeI/OmpD-associated family protein [Flavobacterium silvaticum]
MLKKGEHIEGIPAELQQLLDSDEAAKAFFESLARSHKQAYCDWVGSAKQETTRHTRAGKAILMLRNNQKTLKTV